MPLPPVTEEEENSSMSPLKIATRQCVSRWNYSDSAAAAAAAAAATALGREEEGADGRGWGGGGAGQRQWRGDGGRSGGRSESTSSVTGSTQRYAMLGRTERLATGTRT